MLDYFFCDELHRVAASRSCDQHHLPPAHCFQFFLNHVAKVIKNFDTTKYFINFFQKNSKIIEGGISALKANVCRKETPNFLTRSSPFIVMKLQKTFETFKTRSPPPGVSNVLNVFFIFGICRTHHLPASQTKRTLYIIYNIINIYLQYIPLSHLCASQNSKRR